MNLNLLDPKLIALVAAVIVIAAVLAWLYVRKRRSTTEELRQKFGPEYDRAVLKHGSERKAEAKLADREKRVEKLTDFDQRAADISVDHPRVVENYRSAHEIALRVGKAETTTEELRTAMIHYRWLIEELMQIPTIVERKEVA